MGTRKEEGAGTDILVRGTCQPLSPSLQTVKTKGFTGRGGKLYFCSCTYTLPKLSHIRKPSELQTQRGLFCSVSVHPTVVILSFPVPPETLPFGLRYPVRTPVASVVEFFDS